MLITTYIEPLVGLLFLSIGLFGFYKLTQLYKEHYELYPWFDDHKLKLITLSAPFGVAVLIQYTIGLFIEQSIITAIFSVLLPVVLIIIMSAFLKNVKEIIVNKQFDKHGKEMPKDEDYQEAQKSSFENPAYGTEENPNLDLAEESDSDIHDVADRFKDNDD